VKRDDNWATKADELLRLGLMHKGQREFLGTVQPDAAEFIVENLIEENADAIEFEPDPGEESRTLAAAPSASTRFIMRLDDVPRSDGKRPRDGDYFLRSYDPDANDGQGAIEITGAIGAARRFFSTKPKSSRATGARSYVEGALSMSRRAARKRFTNTTRPKVTLRATREFILTLSDAARSSSSRTACPIGKTSERISCRTFSLTRFMSRTCRTSLLQLLTLA
jgi:hypothetical protein